MRALERNKQTFYYALFGTETEILVNGEHTFESATAYGAWTEMRANISPARGESSADVFGADVNYDRVIVTDDVNCPMDEHTVLAIDITPNTRDQLTVEPIYDYVVTKKARSLNSVQYAVRKVKVDVQDSSDGSGSSDTPTGGVSENDPVQTGTTD